jgi:hypothetical protein
MAKMKIIELVIKIKLIIILIIEWLMVFEAFLINFSVEGTF